MFYVRDQMNSTLFVSAIRDQMRLPVYDVRDQVEQARLVSAIRDQTGLPQADVKDQMSGRLSLCVFMLKIVDGADMVCMLANDAF